MANVKSDVHFFYTFRKCMNYTNKNVKTTWRSSKNYHQWGTVRLNQI